MGCLFSVDKKEEFPSESLYIPLLQQRDVPLYHTDSKSSIESLEKSLRENDEPISGTLSFRSKSKSPAPIFESCQEQPPPKILQIEDRLERLEMNTQENLKLISDDIHLIYQAMIDNRNKKKNKTYNTSNSIGEYLSDRKSTRRRRIRNKNRIRRRFVIIRLNRIPPIIF